MKLFFLLFLTAIIGRSASAKETLGNQLETCFELTERISVPCKNCKNAPGLRKVEACLLKAGLGQVKCEYGGYNLYCNAGSADRLFPKSRSCILTFEDDTTGSSAVLRKDKATAGNCSVDGFEIKEAEVPVNHAVLENDGKWNFTSPMIGYGFDKFLPHDSVIALSIERRSDLGGSREDGCDPERIVERNDSSDFPIVTAFMTKASFKICGVAVPKGTTLNIGSGLHSCSELIDGASILNGFPIALFPKIEKSIRKEERKKTKFAYCIPRHRDHPVDGSSHDWQSCTCGPLASGE